MVYLDQWGAFVFLTASVFGLTGPKGQLPVPLVQARNGHRNLATPSRWYELVVRGDRNELCNVEQWHVNMTVNKVSGRRASGSLRGERRKVLRTIDCGAAEGGR